MPTIELIPCQQCGTRFQPVRRWQKFCGDICRQNWHREQREHAMRLIKQYGLMQDETSWQRRTGQ